MSSEEEAVAAADEVCASCGIAAIDDVKLKKCACKLVKYCSDICRELDRPGHDGVSRKQSTELRDIDLFAQPDESHFGECPICCFPLPLDARKSTFMSCCSKIICNGCNYANKKRELEAGLEQRCAFCREPTSKTDEEGDKRCMKRIKENNDPLAMCRMGRDRYLEGDYEIALEYFTKAAGLGDTEAHYKLSLAYLEGHGVEQDIKKAVHHWEEAAIGGHPDARYNLGVHELNNGRCDRARKHFIIAANLGNDDSLEGLRQFYKEGYASKEEYATALRAYQAAVDATKSPERRKVEEAIKNEEIQMPRDFDEDRRVRYNYFNV